MRWAEKEETSPRSNSSSRVAVLTCVVLTRAVVLPLCIMAALTWLLQLLLVGATVQPLVAATNSSSTSLADLALQKVLKNSEQIFGVRGADLNTTTYAANWMSQVADSTLLVHMNIPGTHDSATWNFSQATSDSIVRNTDPANDVALAKYYRCQQASSYAALDAGVRFFDLRYAADPTFTQLVFWHSEALLSAVATVNDVMYGFYAWLDAHPTETVLLSFQYEGSTQTNGTNDALVQTLLFDLLTDAAAQKYILQTHDELGTLGDARGKIILFRRFDMDQLPSYYEDALPGLHLSPANWTDDSKDIALVYNSAKNLTAYVEDYYEPDDLVNESAAANIAAKFIATTAHLAKAASNSSAYRDSLFITFASAEHDVNLPPVTPQIMAVGNGTDSTPAGGVNQQLLPYLKTLKGQRVGIVVLDFWDQPGNLVETILSL